MSRQSTVAQRNLTLTEELEKLEQSITLTLQEIDHNFSRAHRIVTSSILPIVERYREHSNDVWEGSKFWKQFFEASANVSLSGYEESPLEAEDEEEDGEEEDETISAITGASAQTTPSNSTYASETPSQDEDEGDVTVTPRRNHTYPTGGDVSPSPAQSTPRPNAKSKAAGSKVTRPPTTAPYSSPYENLKRDTLGPPTGTDTAESLSDSTMPSTPQGRMSPKGKSTAMASSPFAPPSAYQRNNNNRTPANDVLLHRVLDKNWRIQATPHSTARVLPHYQNKNFGGRDEQQQQEHQTPRPSTTRRAQRQQQQQQQRGGQRSLALADDDLDSSSPAAPAPELHAEIFDTPARTRRIPGVSVLTPARDVRRGIDKTPGQQEAVRTSTMQYQDDLWDSDEDIEDIMSPPKTMQFHVPQSRLVRTPAREASKRIVEDLLLTAGMRDGLEETEEEGDDSPSIVRKADGILEDDTF